MARDLNPVWAIFKKLLSPAVMTSTGEAGNNNGRILRGWCDRNGVDVENSSDEQLASDLVRAATAEALRIRWDVKPASVAKYDDKGLPNATKTIHEANAFVEKVHKAAADAEQKKLDDKARNTTKNLIESMVLSKLSTTADYKLRLHKRVERAVKQNVKWDAIQRDIARLRQAIEQADERSLERTGFQYSIEDMLEKAGVEI